ncbi:MAG: PAS domain-containing sensor histidine kinase [Sulfurimonas sp. RIFOXYD12_FULL_33_39]|uniref:PAS domain-containing sensor histidine kinase n=1 Tax=unclassified Sulfurimonas TaxID=2623549 RepID=UPI0008BEF0D1|nr:MULTISPECIES: PAS domain-containing sensor histidine kinase [unclassified Sulfurimonas]OHE05516.1 MAG: PAS domain-containing sensor histidine kinase [Sulfurimonas sp. RIFCSPLOWO2_12_FULL_34_6]OHE09263.1 MAG: PAS domain-containing sensor histidine kinase [Sulfurimonas sp. RIFOXYD12_FULL_33_39]OHE12954.1 MAG: PAS domain-containing sensor histidine kinase [Sulfurimonas sp. RIFOXYD2_FULL_34_21]DAB27830.1 MAG TPA: PAS domain-containing sensor histidine kinase [Sulfurimonas sp. UBA10385]
MLKQYKEAIEKSNIISKTDVNGIITFVNDEFCNISGYTKDELIGQNHNIVRHPDVDDEKFKYLWETIKHKNIFKDTVKNLAKNGTTFYVNTTIIPILDKNENIVEFVAIRYDVTKEVALREELLKKEREYEELNKSLEKRVQEQTKELQELNQTLEKRVRDEIAKNEDKQRVMFWQSRHASLGQMLANIAHQWRQPLTELSLAMFNIKKALQNEQADNVTKFYDESKNIIKNMSETIDDFTNFFSPDKEKYYFNISESIRESIGLLESVINDEMIIIKTEFNDIKVLGITNELTQVIINLINNSKDAFIHNSILLREINITTKKERDFAVIEVHDNAGGISKENIEKIFEPYFTTKHKSRGTGLGLFMSKMICEQGLNGTLDVKSKKNTTTFSIKIPLDKHEK